MQHSTRTGLSRWPLVTKKLTSKGPRFGPTYLLSQAWSRFSTAVLPMPRLCPSLEVQTNLAISPPPSTLWPGLQVQGTCSHLSLPENCLHKCCMPKPASSYLQINEAVVPDWIKGNAPQDGGHNIWTDHRGFRAHHQLLQRLACISRKHVM